MHFNGNGKTPVRKSVHLTGQTAEHINDIFEKNSDDPRTVPCYICRREDGQHSLWSDENDMEQSEGGLETEVGRMNVVPIQVSMFRREVSGVVFYYPLCVECVVLLGLQLE
jgi:hypothetical protein